MEREDLKKLSLRELYEMYDKALENNDEAFLALIEPYVIRVYTSFGVRTYLKSIRRNPGRRNKK